MAWIVTNSELNTIKKTSCFITGQNKINQDFHKELSIEKIENEGKSPKNVLNDFITDINKVLNNDGKLVSHNCEFDINILFNECFYASIDINKDLILDNSICTKESTTDICKLTPKIGIHYKYPKLSELYTVLYGKNPDKKLHRALNDTEILLDCAKKLQQTFDMFL